MIWEEYFVYKCNDYIIVVEKYINWPCVIEVAGGGSSKEFVQCIKSISETFGIHEEISPDGGVQFTANKNIFFKIGDSDLDYHQSPSRTAILEPSC